MKPIVRMMDQPGFIGNLFEFMPSGILIVDAEGRVQALNNVLEKTFGVFEGKITDKNGNEILRCLQSLKMRKKHTFGEECKTCGICNTAVESSSKENISRNKIEVQMIADGKVREMDLIMSSGPLYYENERLTAFVLGMPKSSSEPNSHLSGMRTGERFAGIIGRNAKMKEVFNTIEDVSELNIPILIHGESGTGKELVAAAIHNAGPRAKKPFVPVDCGALPESLIERELFGQARSAFTGALKDKKGRFELAHGGTIFLDEVTDLSKSVQEKLLRVIQESKFEPEGSENTVSVDVRIISAANCYVNREVEKGNFRDGFYSRINVAHIHMPPLRRRTTDIPLLVDYFLEKSSFDGQKTSGISKEALAIMMGYPWPGNIRELQSAIRYSLVKSKGRIIRPENFPLELKEWIRLHLMSLTPVSLDVEGNRAALIHSKGKKSQVDRLLDVGRSTL